MPRITRADGSVYTTMVHNPRRRLASDPAPVDSPKSITVEQLGTLITDLCAAIDPSIVVPPIKSLDDATAFVKSLSGDGKETPPEVDALDEVAAMSQRLGRTFPAGTQFRTCGNAIVASVPRGLNGKGGWGFERYEPTTGGGYRRS